MGRNDSREARDREGVRTDVEAYAMTMRSRQPREPFGEYHGYKIKWANMPRYERCRRISSACVTLENCLSETIHVRHASGDAHAPGSRYRTESPEETNNCGGGRWRCDTFLPYVYDVLPNDGITKKQMRLWYLSHQVDHCVSCQSRVD